MSSLLRWSIRLVLAGLVVELFSLFGLSHPWGFLLFAMVACTLVGAGVVLFLIQAFRPSAEGREEVST